ncbi:SpaA isopeptide-forming pilin-related protein [Sphingomonas sp. R86521]|uniref:SpaA isopeptide-forming pilin-related protein n=1 Tax=Sphingomonas sp. R86521 TaxID=3093860 RepID=UPI0036D217B0
MRIPLLAALVLCLPAAAQAHEIWIERDGSGPARVYLGEPGEPMPVGGDPEFAKLKAPRILARPGAVLTRRAGFLETKLPAGDVRAWDDTVFALWGPDGKKEGVVYYARAGRAEPRAKLPFELAPVTANGSRFVLTRDGKPLPGAKVALYAPDRSKTELTTDADGTVETSAAKPGRYLLVASRTEEGPVALPGGNASLVYRITTTSYVVPG